MDWLGENFELMALGPRLFQQIGGGGLAGEEQDLAVRHLLRVAMAASMPVMPVMMTSLMSMSGLKVSSASTAFSPLYTARASKPAWFRMMASVLAMTCSSSATRTLGLDGCG